MIRAIGKVGAATVAALGFPGSVAMDTVGFLDTLAAADWILARNGSAAPPKYKIEVLGLDTGVVGTMLGIGLMASRAFEATQDIHTLMVPGGSDEAVTALIGHDRLMEWLRHEGPRVQRLVAIGTGTFVLAAAGLLSGRRVTTHWGSCERLKAAHPDLEVEHDNIFVQDGNIFTAAGVSSAIDLALHLIELDFGRGVAFEVAQAAILSLKRSGGQPQFSHHLLAQSASPRLLKGTPEWIVEHLQGDLSVEALAARAGMSMRNFIRVFTREIGLTPGKFVERARVEKARQLIQDSDLPIKTIAVAAGFGSEQNMRRSFIRVLGLNPGDYAQRLREKG